ncbi:PLP-dependent transferase [Thozetella sp. PMI_491]|nr:PLP-dependent transferase [Thozetella sp. PMI_491]
MTNRPPSRLEQLLAGHLARRKENNQFRSLTTVTPGTVDFSSNAYLSLASNVEIQTSYLAKLESQLVTPVPRHGSGLLGSGGSRLLDGNSELAERLEHSVAKFHGAEAGLLFNSAMDANVGLFSCVPQPGDILVFDELIHASVHDGMRLSRATRRIPFAHNCVREETAGNSAPVTESTPRLKALEVVLKDLHSGSDGDRIKDGSKNVFIAVEGIYSMDGDVVPLTDVVECVERHLPLGNGYIIVDEAHSVGVRGDKGRGRVCELGLEDRIWARVVGFGKALGCAGGIVLCSQTTRSYLINYARSLIYTTAMAFTSLASIETVYEFLTAGRAEPLVLHLRGIICHTHNMLLSICSRHRPLRRLLHANADTPQSPIIPLFTSYPRSLARHCQQNGFMVRPIVAPTVPKRSERVRICLHAGNTIDQIDNLGRTIEIWLVNWTESKGPEEEMQELAALSPPGSSKTAGMEGKL